MKVVQHLERKPDDPICMRVSLGGGKMGFYCVYRHGPGQGTPEIISLLEAALNSMRNKQLQEEHEDPTRN